MAVRLPSWPRRSAGDQVAQVGVVARVTRYDVFLPLTPARKIAVSAGPRCANSTGLSRWDRQPGQSGTHQQLATGPHPVEVASRSLRRSVARFLNAGID